MSRKSTHKQSTGTDNDNKRRSSHYEYIMKTFTKQHKEVKCNYEEMPTSPHTFKTFLTGSSYEGVYDEKGMNGFGEYTFPNGVVYRGEFQDGMFHGTGELIYKDGPEADTVIRGTWVNGTLTERNILFNGTLEYNENDWNYCVIPDRRYEVEFDMDLQSAGKARITPDVPPREIPPGYYDTGDGLYHPETKVVFRYDKLDEVVRSPSEQEQKWIVENCRKEPLGFIGPRPDFYETWLPPNLEPAQHAESLVRLKSKNRYPSIISEQQSLMEQMFGPVFYDPTKIPMS